MTNKTNEMMDFTNDLYGSVRAVNIDGKAWFFGRDIVKDLGYAKHYTDVLKVHVRDKYQQKLNFTDLGKLGVTDAGRKGEVLINEYGVIQLVMASSLPQAEQFQDWIIEEVIPSVLQHGAYIDSSRADALPYVEEKLAEMEKMHEIDERYISSLRQRIQQAVKDRNSAWQVQADRREIIDEMQILINMLIDGQELTREQLKQLAKIDALRELTGNVWITK